MIKPKKTALLPINKFDFEEIRTKEMIYVDKTELIYQMISMPDNYFLSRPRRFGKSLFVSVLKHLYKGHRHYFRGLWIDKYADWEWKEWPVVIFDFNRISNADAEALTRGFKSALNRNANKYDVKLQEFDIKEQFGELISKLYEKTKSKIIILVDEYDKPIIDHLSDENEIKIANANRMVMKEFFGVLKDSDTGPLVELLFITGVSKFSQVSIFPDLNTLTDLSMNEKYATVLGYTEQEIDWYFTGWIDKWSIEKNIDPKMIREKIKERYNGFRFSKSNVKVYNPISVLRALYEQDYKSNYWFITATPTFLINLLAKDNFNIPDIEKARMIDTDFHSFDPDNIHLVALMVQTGYLTINDVYDHDESPVLYSFDFPNVEVKESFLKLLMDKLGDIQKYNPDHYFIQTDLRNNRLEMAIKTIEKIFSLIPKLDFHNAAFFHNFFYMMIRSACPFSRTLDTNDKMSILIDFKDKQYVLNFSCVFSAEEMLLPINEKVQNKEVYQVGIHFDLKHKIISEWKREILIPEAVLIPEEQKSSVKIFKLFLASANDLAEERKEITLWINRKNKIFLKNNKFVDLVLWEDLLHSFQGKRIQDYFNSEMLDCHVVIALFYSKVGEFTKEEFELAYENLKAGKKPYYLFAAFKNAQISIQDISKDYFQIMQLREQIQEDEQLYLTFDSMESLILKLDAQLEKIMEKI
ncbi:ATPase AAA [Candidatus Magnetomorum sp. HK-1]|nr:ATPase AAA [Candidatus Magnetomorum sp. HK-1]